MHGATGIAVKVTIKPDVNCCRCDQPATFDSPRDFCDEHWARWFGGFDAELPFEGGEPPSDQLYEDALCILVAMSKGELAE